MDPLMKELKEEQDRCKVITDLVTSAIKEFESPGPNRLRADRTENVIFKKFLVLNFNIYGLDLKGKPLPSEYCITEFSIANGVQASAWSLIDIGKIPLGCRSDFMKSVQITRCPLPPFTDDFDFDKNCLSKVERCLELHEFPKDGPGIVFTLRHNISQVQQCLDYVCQRAERHINVKVLPYEVLMQTLFSIGVQVYKKPTEEKEVEADADSRVFCPKRETDILALVTNPKYQDVLEIACPYHQDEEHVEGLDSCPMSENKRMIFSCMGLLASYFSCRRFAGHHYPLMRPREPTIFIPVEPKKWNSSSAGVSASSATAPTPSNSVSSAGATFLDASTDASGGSSATTPTRLNSVSSSEAAFLDTSTDAGGRSTATTPTQRNSVSSSDAVFLDTSTDASCGSTATTPTPQNQAGPSGPVFLNTPTVASGRSTATAPTPLPPGSFQLGEPYKPTSGAGTELPDYKPTKDELTQPMFKLPLPPPRVKQIPEKRSPVDEMLDFLMKHPLYEPSNLPDYMDEFDRRHRPIHDWNMEHTKSLSRKLARVVLHDQPLAPGLLFWDLTGTAGQLIRVEAPGHGIEPLFTDWEKAFLHYRYIQILEARRAMAKQGTDQQYMDADGTMNEADTDDDIYYRPSDKEEKIDVKFGRKKSSVVGRLGSRESVISSGTSFDP